MASKYGVLACLTCGEFVRSTMNETIQQFEMHMCCGQTTTDEKRSKLLQLRNVIDKEIAKMAQVLPSNVPKPPPPPPLLAPLSDSRATQLQTSSSSQGINHSFYPYKKWH